MNRLPLWLSIAAMVIAVAALGLAFLLPGPQGPKGDTGPQGIQGIQGPPNSLLVERQVASFNVTNGICAVPCIETTYEPCLIDLNAGDVLQGYFSGAHYNVDYLVWVNDVPYHDTWLLGSGQGGSAFCYVAEATGRYQLYVSCVDEETLSNQYRLPYSEDVPVVYWVQEGAKQAE
jgi:hypothetical protein